MARAVGAALRHPFTALVGALLLTTPAQAQDCYALRQQRDALDRRMQQLIADYPGTHLIIGMCAASAQSEYERSGDRDAATNSFIGCATIGCLFAGFDSCATVASAWFKAAIEKDDLDRKMARC